MLPHKNIQKICYNRPSSPCRPGTRKGNLSLSFGIPPWVSIFHKSRLFSIKRNDAVTAAYGNDNEAIFSVQVDQKRA